MTKILFLALMMILSGCLAINHSKNPEFQPILTASEDRSTAKVLNVEAIGEPNDYTFAVTISSPDTGCDRYADWWEVITPEGELLYRRILLHSHVDEQPFQRTGGVVAIDPQQIVIIRVHMSSDGYSPIAQQGTVKSGFSAVTLPEEFAASLALVEPLPESCAF
ncbi:MAG: hypothetical protein AAGF26_04710 [Cyanobacteria bacterium P01_G01_bin.49]